MCLLRLGITREAFHADVIIGKITVDFPDSTYAAAPGNTSGFFKTGQDADTMLSGIDFNNTGGPLLFNHPGGIASDGTHLLLADTFNNRVLVWNSPPEGNVEPDLVLGQESFATNSPGTGLDQMNWPISVVTDGQRVVVADTENHRILIWHSFPTKNGEPADLVIQGGDPYFVGDAAKVPFIWPWGVWTNGEKLAVTSTKRKAVLIWNEFPTVDNQPPDITLTGGDMGTPRQITSDGESLIVGDHNARVPGRPGTGSFVWRTFPTADDQPYDFYMNDPVVADGPWLHGVFSPEGKLFLFGRTLHVWDSLPANEDDLPDVSISTDAFDFPWGDSGGLAVAGERLYVSNYNGNKVLVYNSLPTRNDQVPDFAIGSPDIHTNTLETNFVITNPLPASNGESLLVASDADKKLYVWQQLPNESGAHPDIVYSLPFPPTDITLWGDTLLLAGPDIIYAWETLPLHGELPDRVFYKNIGSTQLHGVRSIAVDDRYFYLVDYAANKVYIWEGFPSEDSVPAFVLEVERPWRVSSDGNYLTVATFDRQMAYVYPMEGLSVDTEPVSIDGGGTFNGVFAVEAVEGRLFLTDLGNHRVVIWNDIVDALSGQEWDVVLGTDSYRPQIGRDKLFMPATISFDGAYLWVGETKFSMRLLRFSPSP